MQYFRLATQYYVAGRYSALVWLIPVAGNLLHHAIEMYLKGLLARNMGPAKIKELGHRLPLVWERFKATLAGGAEGRFDPIIQALDRFEFIRYPDRIMSDGMFSTISLAGPPPKMDPTTPQGPMPEYHLVVDDVDALVKTIFAHAGVNVAFFTSMLHPGAMEYLVKNNRHFST